jgi:hypothetical protein
MLTPVEDFWLRWHAEHSSDELATRARLVLEAETGGSPARVAADLGLSPQKAEGVLAEFEHDRLATFPRATVRLDDLIKLDTPDDHLRRQHIAHQARRLFNDTQPLHHLPRKTRQLLEAAALLPPLPPAAPAGGVPRELDMLDGAVLADLGPAEQAIISCILHFQRKGFRADRDPLFKPLRPAEQSQARYLAALLQVAINLDASGSELTELKGAELHADTVVLRLLGPKARSDGAQACRQTWLWRPVFHSSLAYEIGPRRASAPEQGAVAEAGDEPAGAVFGRQLAAALRQWEPRLAGVAGAESLELRDQLAGVSDALAAVGAFATMLKRQPVKDAKKPLRRLQKRLMAVVEQQNALSDLDSYMQGRPAAALAELQPLHEAWERETRQQQSSVKATLESDATAELRQRLTEMAANPPMRHRKTSSMHVAARVLLDEVIGELAERQEKVVTDRPKTYRRYQESLGRLACALDAIGAKGDDAARLAADVQRLEARIERWLASNALNDAIAAFLDEWAEQQARRKAPQLFGAQAVLAYRQARRAQWTRLRSSLAEDWRPLRASRLRRRTNKLLGQLRKK